MKPQIRKTEKRRGESREKRKQNNAINPMSKPTNKSDTEN